MNDNYLFSIIIPHKNIPDLLQRCLDSIPRRDDVQIIVVDDNSDSEIVDFKNFPGINDPYVEIYFTKKGKGAGYARNVGLEHAKGKWIIFADADDMFLGNFNEYLNKCYDFDYDAIIFNYENKLMNGDMLYPGSITTDNPKIVFPSICFPWCKIIRKSIIDTYNIRFQEVYWSNDLMFAVQLAKYTHRIYVDSERVYLLIERPGSLCTKVTWQSLYCRTKVALKAFSCMKEYPESEPLRLAYMQYWKDLFHKKTSIAIYMIPRICYVMGIRNTIKDLCVRIKTDYPKFFK